MLCQESLKNKDIFMYLFILHSTACYVQLCSAAADLSTSSWSILELSLNYSFSFANIHRNCKGFVGSRLNKQDLTTKYE